jgi:hypothetical protein
MTARSKASFSRPAPASHCVAGAQDLLLGRIHLAVANGHMTTVLSQDDQRRPLRVVTFIIRTIPEPAVVASSVRAPSSAPAR